MTRLAAAVPLSLAVSLLGCATAVKPPAPPIPMSAVPAGEAPGDYQPSGELTWTDLTGVNPVRRASFDEWRINGPRMALRRAPDGKWIGKVSGREATLVTSAGKVAGGGIDLALTSDEKGGVAVDGLWGGRPVHLILGKQSIKGTIPGGQIDLTDMGAGMFNSYQGLLQISGPPDMPQVVLALLAVILG
jgi:hypothetical protein